MSVYYQDAWSAVHPNEPGHTFTPLNPLRSDAWKPRPGRRIDYILVRCGTHGATLDIAACDLVFDEPIDGDSSTLVQPRDLDGWAWTLIRGLAELGSRCAAAP
jgi:hypothetical protein